MCEVAEIEAKEGTPNPEENKVTQRELLIELWLNNTRQPIIMCDLSGRNEDRICEDEV